MYNIIVDGHCDTLQRAFDENLSIFNTKFDFNMTNAEFVKPYIQFLASFINTKYDIGNTAYVRVNEMLDKFYKEYNENKNADIVLIDTKSDLQKIINEGKIGIEVNANNKSYVHPRNFAYICDTYASHTLVGEIYNEDIKIIQINFSYSLNDSIPYRIYRIKDDHGNLYVENFVIYDYNGNVVKKIEKFKDDENRLFYTYLRYSDDNVFDVSSEGKISFVGTKHLQGAAGTYLTDDDKVINLLVDDNNIADSDIVSGIFEFSYLGNNNFSDIKFVDSRSTVKDLKK